MDFLKRNRPLVKDIDSEAWGLPVDKRRLKFYWTFLGNVDKNMKIIEEYNANAAMLDTYNQGIKDVVRYGDFMEKSPKNIKDINSKLGPMKLMVDKKGGGTSFFETKLGELKGAEAAAAEAAKSPPDLKIVEAAEVEQTKVINSVMKHPLYSPDNEKTTATDIGVFIGLTFIMRGIALFVVDWAVSSQMVVTISEGCTLYIGVYLLLFFAVCLMVNTGDGEENPFKVLFYYLNTDFNTSIRIYVHAAFQFMSLPLIGIVRDQSLQPDDSFAQRQTTQRVVSDLTLFIWIMTSIIATRL